MIDSASDSDGDFLVWKNRVEIIGGNLVGTSWRVPQTSDYLFLQMMLVF